MRAQAPAILRWAHRQSQTVKYPAGSSALVKEGDVILTSGSGNIYPKDIKIGEVIGVTEDKVKLMKVAIVEPYVDYNKLEELMVIVPKDKREIKY